MGTVKEWAQDFHELTLDHGQTRVVVLLGHLKDDPLAIRVAVLNRPEAGGAPGDLTYKAGDSVLWADESNEWRRILKGLRKNLSPSTLAYETVRAVVLSYTHRTRRAQSRLMEKLHEEADD